MEGGALDPKRLVFIDEARGSKHQEAIKRVEAKTKRLNDRINSCLSE